MTTEENRSNLYTLTLIQFRIISKHTSFGTVEEKTKPQSYPVGSLKNIESPHRVKGLAILLGVRIGLKPHALTLSQLSISQVLRMWEKD